MTVPADAGKTTYASGVTPALILLLLVTAAAAGWQVYDVVNNSMGFIARRPLWMKVAFAYGPLALVAALVIGVGYALVVNGRRNVTIGPDGVEYSRPGADGSLADYLRVTWKDLHYTHAGAGPLARVVIGDMHRKEVLYALFFKDLGEIARRIEERRGGKGGRQAKVASMYLNHVEKQQKQKERDPDAY